MTDSQNENKTNENKADVSTEDMKPIFTIANLVFNPKVLIGAVLIYAGLGIPLLLRTESDLLNILARQAPVLIGAFAALIGFALMAAEMKKFRQSQREDRFIDVDESRTDSDRRFQVRILNEIKSIKAHSGNLTAEKIEALISEATEKKVLDNEVLFSSFENYFSEIKNTLIEQAHVADKKASILLDKGTAYSKGGITFFIISIVAWQILSGIWGFQEQYIYGIVSCSLLFIFIEFLAAWFLKQYRNFVDTSTYLIKVKSIFDKYMLSFLTIKSVGNTSENNEDKYKAMLKILQEDIKWPDTYLLKQSDISFAKEAMETMTHFAKVMKSEVKSKSD